MGPTEHNVLGFDVHVHYFVAVHHSQILQELQITAPAKLYPLAQLHGELDAVVKDEYIEAKARLHCRPAPEAVTDFGDAVLLDGSTHGNLKLFVFDVGGFVGFDCDFLTEEGESIKLTVGAFWKGPFFGHRAVPVQVEDTDGENELTNFYLQLHNFEVVEVVHYLVTKWAIFSFVIVDVAADKVGLNLLAFGFDWGKSFSI